MPKPVQGVAAGSLLGVDPGGWNDFGVAVFAHAHGPVALVDQGVVEPAHDGSVVHAGGSPVDPELDVVDFGPAGGPVAGESA